MSGGILSTSKTVIDDNASLNVRWDDLPTSVQAQYLREELRQPVRVILDRQNHLTDALKLFHTGVMDETLEQMIGLNVRVPDRVIGDLRAICERPAQAAIAEFKEALARYGKAKLKLRASIVENGVTAVDVTAAFVVTR